MASMIWSTIRGITRFHGGLHSGLTDVGLGCGLRRWLGFWFRLGLLLLMHGLLRRRLLLLTLRLLRSGRFKFGLSSGLDRDLWVKGRFWLGINLLWLRIRGRINRLTRERGACTIRLSLRG